MIASGTLRKTRAISSGLFKIELVGFGFQSLGVVECGVGLHAHEDILRRSVLLLAVVDVIRGHKGQSEALGQRDEVAVDLEPGPASP